MKTNKTFIPLAILLVTFMVAGEANNFVYASSDYDRDLEQFYAEQSKSSQTTKTHSVTKGETLLGIALKKGVISRRGCARSLPILSIILDEKL